MSDETDAKWWSSSRADKAAKKKDAQKNDAQKDDAQKDDAQKNDAPKNDAEKNDAPKNDAQKDDVDAKRSVVELEEYDMKRRRRGLAVIINNRDFDQNINQKRRDGTDVDAEKLEKMLTGLGFDVSRHDNLKTFDMIMTMKEAAEEDHGDADCFLCAILSHGDEGLVYGTNGTVRLDQLIENFKGDKCTSLIGKPKIFFIQACRGDCFDQGVKEDTLDAVKSSSCRKIPVEADVFIGYSVCPGYFSWRNNTNGSWYIQSICKVFTDRAHDLPLLQLMTIVNRKVATEYFSRTGAPATNDMKQMPSFASTLTKNVIFHPKSE